MDRTRNAIFRQLKAMGAPLYEFGLGEQATGKFILQRWTLDVLDRSIGFLKSRNAKGWNVYVRPVGSTGIVLVDDLTREQVARMTSEGASPSVVTETSPKNFQAWVRVASSGVDKDLATAAAKVLARRYDGDANSADWRHFGRLAGFTNRKPKYATDEGRFPFVMLRDARTHVATAGADILEDARHLSTSEKRRFAPPKIEGNPESPAVLYEHYARRILRLNSGRSWVRSPDWSRMDWMVGGDLLSAGYPADLVAAAIREGSPDLPTRHKGAERMENYVQHTVKKLEESRERH